MLYELPGFGNPLTAVTETLGRYLREVRRRLLNRFISDYNVVFITFNDEVHEKVGTKMEVKILTIEYGL